MKRGLVLEGGGMRGMFTCGIIDVMMEAGITLEGMIGVSAGAAFGCNYKSKQIGRALRYNLKFAKDSRYMGLGSLFSTGNLINAEFAYHEVPTKHDIFDTETFASNPMEFHIVCTDAQRGVPVYHQLHHVDYEGLEWVRASASMPAVSKPVLLDGMELLDGGITDSIPLKYFQSIGYERNIVILTQPRGFFKKRTKLMPLISLFSRKYPAIVKAMRERHTMYNAQLEYISEQERLGNTLLIYPEKPIDISRTATKEEDLKRVYNMGREKGIAMLPKIKEFLQKLPSTPYSAAEIII